MIPNNTTTITSQGSLGGKQVQMKLDENSLAHLVTVLTDLYSDPELACIREYATNAYDAHKDAGTKRPIEISTPTPLSPFFKVKDYGVGMSVDDIENIYSKYGASTKRESNEVVGMLGLGCKSALTYTNSFTLISVKNGVRIEAAVSRQPDGTGMMEIVDTKTSTEPNGVEVVIPVKDRNSFEKKAFNFFSYWEKGSVLVNGVQPKPFDHTIKIDDSMYIINDGDYWNKKGSVIVMGNVPYPVDPDRMDLPYAFNGYSFVAFVPMGSVNFPPSREALNYTPRTISEVNEQVRKMKSHFVAKALSEVKNAPSYAQAWRNYAKYRGILSGQNVTYKSETLGGYHHKITCRGFTYRPHAARYSVESVNGFGMQDEVLDYLWIKGYNINTSGITATNKKKIREYISNNSLSPRKIVLVDQEPTSVWLDETTFVDWADIAAIRLAPPAAGGGRGAPTRPPMTWDYYDKSGVYHYHQAKLPKSKILLFASPADEMDHGGLLTNLGEDAILVELGKNRWEKFKRDNPAAMEATAYFQAVLKDKASKITKEYRAYRKIPSRVRTRVEAFAKRTIDDPALSAKIASITADHSDQEKLVDSITNLVRAGNGKLRMPNTVYFHENYNYTDPFHKYPLVNSGNVNHSVIYINAVYAASQKGSK